MSLRGNPIPPGCHACTLKESSVLVRVETLREGVFVNRTRNVSHSCLGFWLMSLILMLATAGRAQAEWVSEFPDEPGRFQSSTNLVISNWFLDVGYDGAGNFSVSSQYPGVAVMNNFTDPIYDIGSESTLNIALSIDPATGAPLSGTLTITGDASEFYTPKGSGTLLTGTICQFGFPGATDAANSDGAQNFQFLFKTTGGDLATYFPSIAVNLNSADVDFNGTFGDTPFFTTDSFSAQSDTFSGFLYATPVPEPSSVLLLCLGVLTLTAGPRILRGAKTPRAMMRSEHWAAWR